MYHNKTDVASYSIKLTDQIQYQIINTQYPIHPHTNLPLPDDAQPSPTNTVLSKHFKNKSQISQTSHKSPWKRKNKIRTKINAVLNMSAPVSPAKHSKNTLVSASKDHLVALPIKVDEELFIEKAYRRYHQAKKAQRPREREKTVSVKRPHDKQKENIAVTYDYDGTAIKVVNKIKKAKADILVPQAIIKQHNSQSTKHSHSHSFRTNPTQKKIYPELVPYTPESKFLNNFLYPLSHEHDKNLYKISNMNFSQYTKHLRRMRDNGWSFKTIRFSENQISSKAQHDDESNKAHITVHKDYLAKLLCDEHESQMKVKKPLRKSKLHSTNLWGKTKNK